MTLRDCIDCRNTAGRDNLLCGTCEARAVRHGRIRELRARIRGDNSVSQIEALVAAVDILLEEAE